LIDGPDIDIVNHVVFPGVASAVSRVMDVVPIFGRVGLADSVVDASREISGEVVNAPVLPILFLVQGVVGVGRVAMAELAGALDVSSSSGSAGVEVWLDVAIRQEV
jgi:formate-dependent nitrite reductase membrane component NrfD